MLYRKAFKVISAQITDKCGDAMVFFFEDILRDTANTVSLFIFDPGKRVTHIQIIGVYFIRKISLSPNIGQTFPPLAFASV